MIGYRKMVLVLAAVGTSAWLAYVGMHAGSDLLALATLVGAKDAAVVGAIFGIAYNKKVTNGSTPK